MCLCVCVCVCVSGQCGGLGGPRRWSVSLRVSFSPCALMGGRAGGRRVPYRAGVYERGPELRHPIGGLDIRVGVDRALNLCKLPAEESRARRRTEHTQESHFATMGHGATKSCVQIDL